MLHLDLAFDHQARGALLLSPAFNVNAHCIFLVGKLQRDGDETRLLPPKGRDDQRIGLGTVE